MKIAAIIPSRYGSTRFDGKPLALISGKPMIQRVYEQARKAASVTDVLVATDDERIVRAVESFGGQAVMTSDENRSGTDRVGEAAHIMGLADEDIIINIQGDQPALCPKSLDLVIAPFRGNPALDMSTLAFVTVDEDEIKTGVRREGTFFGITNFFMRLAMVLSIVTVSLVFTGTEWESYTPNPGVDTLLGLRLLMVLFPALAIGVTLLCLYFYPYPKSKVEEIKKQIAELHEQKMKKVQSI